MTQFLVFLQLCCLQLNYVAEIYHQNAIHPLRVAPYWALMWPRRFEKTTGFTVSTLAHIHDPVSVAFSVGQAAVFFIGFQHPS